MKDKGSLPLESYALDHALLLWVRKLIYLSPSSFVPSLSWLIVVAHTLLLWVKKQLSFSLVFVPSLSWESMIGFIALKTTTPNTALFCSLFSSCLIIYIYIYIITRRVTSMRRRSASNGACSGQYGCKTAETSVSGSARKSQTRLRDTPRFKFQAVLARAQPFYHAA